MIDRISTTDSTNQCYWFNWSVLLIRMRSCKYKWCLVGPFTICRKESHHRVRLYWCNFPEMKHVLRTIKPGINNLLQFYCRCPYYLNPNYAIDLYYILYIYHFPSTFGLIQKWQKIKARFLDDSGAAKELACGSDSFCFTPAFSMAGTRLRNRWPIRSINGNNLRKITLLTPVRCRIDSYCYSLLRNPGLM